MFCNFYKFNIKSFKTNKQNIWSPEWLGMASAGEDIEQQESIQLGRNLNGPKPGTLVDSTYPRLGTHLPKDPAVSLLSMYLTTAGTRAKTLTKMFEAAFVAKALTWKQSKCSVMTEEVNKLCFLHKISKWATTTCQNMSGSHTELSKRNHTALAR